MSAADTSAPMIVMANSTLSVALDDVMGSVNATKEDNSCPEIPMSKAMKEVQVE